MFDLAGLKQMGSDIETFTKETHAALVDIGMQLRIGNAIAAMALADQEHSSRNDLDILRDAMNTASAQLAAESMGEGTDAQ